jgi:hypothetical protein
VRGSPFNPLKIKTYNKGLNMEVVLSVSKCLFINDLDRLIPCDKFFININYVDIKKDESFEMYRYDKESYQLIVDKIINHEITLAIDEDIFDEVLENLKAFIKIEKR